MATDAGIINPAPINAALNLAGEKSNRM